MSMGNAIPMVIPPVAERACRIPTNALELWIRAQRRKPIKTPRKGLEKEVNRFLNSCDSFRGANTSSINDIPMKRTPRPRKMPAIFFGRSFLALIRTRAPIPIIMGAKEDGFRS